MAAQLAPQQQICEPLTARCEFFENRRKLIFVSILRQFARFVPGNFADAADDPEAQ